MLHYDPQHVSSSTLLILRRRNCITTASGIVTLCKQSYSMQVGSGLSPLSTCMLLKNKVIVHWVGNLKKGRSEKQRHISTKFLNEIPHASKAVDKHASGNSGVWGIWSVKFVHDYFCLMKTFLPIFLTFVPLQSHQLLAPTVQDKPIHSSQTRKIFGPEQPVLLPKRYRLHRMRRVKTR